MHSKRSNLSDDLRVEKARGVLARLFRTIAKGIDMSSARWEELLQRVLDHPRNPAPKNSKDRSSIKGNLNKALKGPRMSWKVFERALSFLGIVEMRLEIQCKWPNGNVTSHHVTRRFEGLSYEQLSPDPTEMNGFKLEDNPPPLVRNPPTPRLPLLSDEDREHLRTTIARLTKDLPDARTPPDVPHD